MTRDCSLAMDTLVRSKDKTYLTIDGGHMGILGSSAAQTQSWGRIAGWLMRGTSYKRRQVSRCNANFRLEQLNDLESVSVLLKKPGTIFCFHSKPSVADS